MLMTAAPALMRLPIWATESAQLIMSGEGNAALSARIPGQIPMMPFPLTGAAATDAVAVPWPNAVSGTSVPIVLKLLPAHAGWVMWGIESRSASSGLVGATGGVGVAGLTTALRHHCCGVSGSGVGAAWKRWRSTFGEADTSRLRARSPAASARAFERETRKAPTWGEPTARAPKRRAMAAASAPGVALTSQLRGSARRGAASASPGSRTCCAAATAGVLAPPGTTRGRSRSRDAAAGVAAKAIVATAISAVLPPNRLVIRGPPDTLETKHPVRTILGLNRRTL